MAWDNFIDDLKIRINIVDVVGREVSLKRSGSRYLGLCPFHREKTPSFTVNEEKQFYHCFGCGEHGDVIKFVQQYHKLSFTEAVERLAAEYGIEVPERNQNRPRIDYDKYYSLNAEAARFFYNSLGIRNNPGIAYLRRRGLSKDTIIKFGLGYAPPGGSALTDHLRARGYNDEDILKLGLANNGKNGLYDKFRNRVMFPIINTQGKVIGFGGRAIEDIKPKYLNSPESEIFLKKNNLFGLNFTRSEITAEDRAIIVEGYMDVISLYQSGVRNVAASLGTALTDNQARLLCRYSKNITLSYDSDNAGINAALRGISVITAAGGKPRVLTVDDGKDPDEYVHKHGKEGFIRLADQAVPAADFRLKLARRGIDLDDDRGVLEYIERAVPVLKGLGPVEQDIYIRKLSQEFGISEYAIGMAVRMENSGNGSSPRIDPGRSRQRSRRRVYQAGEKGPDNSTEARIEMALAVLAANNTRYIKRFKADGITFESDLASKVISAITEAIDPLESGTHRADERLIRDRLDPEEDRIFSGYLSSVKIGPDDEAFYRETVASRRINKLRSEKAEVQNDLAIAETAGSEEDINNLAARIIEIDRKIKEASEVENAGQE